MTKQRVTLLIQASVAKEFERASFETPDAVDLASLTEEMGVVLKKMHPESDGVLSSVFYSVEVPDEDSADDFLSRLRSCRAVDGAYIKPVDEPP